MDNFIEIARTEDLPVGYATTVAVGERTIALYHTASGFFASDNTCPHRGGPLGDGEIVNGDIICPWHLWAFDIKSGACRGNPSLAMTTYTVKIEDDRVFVDLSPVREESTTRP